MMYAEVNTCCDACGQEVKFAALTPLMAGNSAAICKPCLESMLGLVKEIQDMYQGYGGVIK